MHFPDPRMYSAEDEARHRVRELRREAKGNARWPREKLPWWLPFLLIGVIIAVMILTIVLLDLMF